MADLSLYEQNAEAIAKALLDGKIIRNLPEGKLIGRILGTGSYEDGRPVQSRRGMLYDSGKIFLMPFRGLTSLNIATDIRAIPSCVEIRAAEFDGQIIETPYKLAKFLSLDYKIPEKNLDGRLLGDELCIELPEKPIPEDCIIINRPNTKSENCISYYSFKK